MMQEVDLPTANTHARPTAQGKAAAASFAAAGGALPQSVGLNDYSRHGALQSFLLCVGTKSSTSMQQLRCPADPLRRRRCPCRPQIRTPSELLRARRVPAGRRAGLPGVSRRARARQPQQAAAHTKRSDAWQLENAARRVEFSCSAPTRLDRGEDVVREADARHDAPKALVHHLRWRGQSPVFKPQLKVAAAHSVPARPPVLSAAFSRAPPHLAVDAVLLLACSRREAQKGRPLASFARHTEWCGPEGAAQHAERQARQRTHLVVLGVEAPLKQLCRGSRHSRAGGG